MSSAAVFKILLLHKSVRLSVYKQTWNYLLDEETVEEHAPRYENNSEREPRTVVEQTADDTNIAPLAKIARSR